MSDTQTPVPARRKQIPAGASLAILASMLLAVFALLYFLAAPMIDRYEHGKVTEGMVKSVISKEYKRKSSTYTAYEHLIEYDGHIRAFVRNNRYEKGTKIAIYYSTQDPQNATVKGAGHPYTSYADILLDPPILLLLAVNALFLLGTLFTFTLWLDERRARERAL